MVVEIGRVDIKDQLTIVGGIRFQAARRDGSIGFQLGEQVSVAGGGLFEVDVPCGALGDNVGVSIAVLFALIVLLGVANSLVRNRTLVRSIPSFLAKGHPSFQGSSRGDGERRCTSAEV